MSLMNFVLLFALGAVDDSTPQFHQDFRNKSLPDLNMKMEKPAHASLVKAEPEGLRITIPADKRYNEAVGMMAPTPIKGDFEITAAYEIIEANRPTGGGFGVGIELYIKAKSPSQEGLGFYRLTRNSGYDSYSCSQMSGIGNKRGPIRGGDHGDKDFPAQGKFGQLRMTRVGSKVILSAADDLGNDFQPKYEMDYVPDDLVMLRIGAHPGGAPNPVDLRLLDLRVRPVDSKSAEIAKVLEKTPTLTSPDNAPGTRRTWLWVLALLVAISLVIGGVLVLLNAKRGKKKSETSAEETESIAEIPLTPIVAKCSGCGKKLKARAELAGKKVKCSQCGQIVVLRAEV
jgi:Protein of unknown function (DUF1583)